MANRHAHKKLRQEIRALMAATGESHQRARSRILGRAERPTLVVDLVPVVTFGVPMTLATSEGGGVHSFTLLGRAPTSAGRAPHPFWLPVMRFLRPRGVS